MAPCVPLLLAGPTAVGKSPVALRLAEIFDGEILCVDSMQVYRGMDVGTAKPSPEDQRRVPHHLLDLVSPDQSFSAADFARLALAAMADLERRGKTAILCGGTGLYFKALIEGIGQGPPPNAGLRAELEATPTPALLHELEEKDPVLLNTLDRDNRRRIIRAVEVIRLTGQPFSAQRSPWKSAGGTGFGPHQFFGLDRFSADLRQRIHDRVDQMFQNGLVAETERLWKGGSGFRQTAAQALGYRQVIDYLENRGSLAETIARVKVRTWQFAKRQRTWFRRQARLTWFELEPTESIESVAARLAQAYQNTPAATEASPDLAAQ